MRTASAIRCWQRVRRVVARRDEGGASLIEFALVLPVFAVLLFGLVDFGLVFGGYVSLENQVNAAARAVAIDRVASSCVSASDPALCTVEAAIGSAPLGVVPGSVETAIAFPDGGTTTAGSSVIVCARAELHSATGISAPILNNRWVSTKSEVLLEQNASVPTPSAPSYSWSDVAGFACS